MNGQWGLICNNEWSNTDALVACMQLGYLSAEKATAGSSYNVKGTLPMHLDAVRCFGGEERLLNCVYSIPDQKCTPEQSAGVKCTTEP